MFQVVWSQRAMSELTAIWLSVGVNERPTLSWAITDLDYRLSRDPANEGE